MARPFSAGQAKNIIKAHQDIQKKLNTAINLQQQSYDKIKSAAMQLAAVEASALLDSIPVEQINRDKLGIRTKALRDSGYETITQLDQASVYQLTAVRGISEENAHTIKKMVKALLAEAGNNVKIRISADNRSPQATALISELAFFKRIKPVVGNCKSLSDTYQTQIDESINELALTAGTFKWLFAGNDKKQKAADAYRFLDEQLNGDYGSKAKQLQSELLSFQSMRRVDANQAWKEFEADSISFINLLEEIVPDMVGGEDEVYGLPEELADQIQRQVIDTKGLNCTLRRYQEWGVKYILHQERVLLGDEMGLGKTVQAIASMVSLKNAGATHFVVVCPASVLTNWCREIEKHSDLSVIKIHGNGKELAFKEWIAQGGAAVTTYETTAHFELADDFSYTLCIVDEAHYIKNPEAKRTVNVKKLCKKAQRLLFMTGTALENKVDEMIALIEVLRPAVATQIKGMAFMAAAPQFREKVAPVYYRRRREDVLTELPELTESREWCTLSPQEEQVYEKTLLEKNYAAVRRVSWNVGNPEQSSKANRLLELVEEAGADGRKIIVFSFFLDTIQLVCGLLGDQCLTPINGSVPPQRRQEIIDEFDKAPAGTVLAAQIQSGGTGLNIQSASVVIFCEPQFKPSIENQAIARAYRMGQARNVLVYRLLCDDTVDEKIMDLLADKQAVFDAFADKSAAADESMEIDEKSFGEIVQEEIERIHAKNSGSDIGTGETDVYAEPEMELQTGNGEEKTNS